MATTKQIQLARRRGYGTFYTWNFELEVYASFNKSFGSNRDTMIVHDYEADGNIRDIVQGCIKALEGLDFVVVRASLK